MYVTTQSIVRNAGQPQLAAFTPPSWLKDVGRVVGAAISATVRIAGREYDLRTAEGRAAAARAAAASAAQAATARLTPTSPGQARQPSPSETALPDTAPAPAGIGAGALVALGLVALLMRRRG